MIRTMFVYGTLFSLLFTLLLYTGIAASSPITDADWTGVGLPRGVDRNVTSLAVDGKGNLIVGGPFYSAGGTHAYFGVAQWNGSVWSSPWNRMVDRQGKDVSHDSEDDFAICIGSDGTLLIGGKGVYASTGSTFSGILDDFAGTDTVDGSVFDMVVYKDLLYAVGEFGMNGRALPDFMQWDGSSWHPLVGGIITTATFSGERPVLCVDSAGSLYAGGTFTSYNDSSVFHIAKWGGSAWVPLGGGVPFNVTSITVDRRGNLYVGGFDVSTSAENRYRPIKSISRWDGSFWEPIETTTTGEISALVCDTTGNLYAGGYFDTIGMVVTGNCAKWNGTTWQPLGTGVDGRITTLASGKNGILYAGGWIYSQGGYLAGHIVQWDGTKWSSLGSGRGFPGSINALVISSDGTLFAGRRDYEESMYMSTLLRRGAEGWMPMRSGVGEDGIYTLLPDNKGGLYAGGPNTPVDTGWCGLAHWDGSGWTRMGLLGVTHEVRAFAMDSAGNVYVAGKFPAVKDSGKGNIACWNGVAWNDLSKGCNGIVSALAVDSRGVLYAGGEFDSAGGSPAFHIAKWDGVSWSPLGTGLAGTCRPCYYNAACMVSSLVFDNNGILYAGGTFEAAGGRPAAHVAKWDGSGWSPLGQGVYGSNQNLPESVCPTVLALLFDNGGNLYAGGVFDSAGSGAARNIARWDGTAWSPLGSGCSGGVSTMVLDKKGTLHVGGGFSSAGGSASSAYAMCQIGTDNNQHAVTAPQPNVRMAAGGTMRIALRTSTEVIVRTYTLSGREVFRSRETMGAGEHLIRMNTGGIGRGVYIVCVKYGGRSFVQRLMVER